MNRLIKREPVLVATAVEIAVIAAAVGLGADAELIVGLAGLFAAALGITARAAVTPNGRVAVDIDGDGPLAPSTSWLTNEQLQDARGRLEDIRAQFNS